mmetsp:Transcript_39672/g.95426  ORF Transcript_39672/g.95426 Transcript_39672/m.95426 type:complete len:282 (-) Transcript_39672:714-1559(-)
MGREREGGANRVCLDAVHPFHLVVIGHGGHGIGTVQRPRGRDGGHAMMIGGIILPRGILLEVGRVPPRVVHLPQPLVALDDLPVPRNVHPHLHDLPEELGLASRIDPAVGSLELDGVEEGGEGDARGAAGDEPVVAHGKLGHEPRELADVVPRPRPHAPGEEARQIPTERERGGGMDPPVQAPEHRILHRDDVLGEEVSSAEVDQAAHPELAGFEQLDREVQGGHCRQLEDATVHGAGGQVAIEVGHGDGDDLAVEVEVVHDLVAPFADFFAPQLVYLGGG